MRRRFSMSTFVSLERAARLDAERDARAAASTYVPPTQLPQAQKMALLVMRKSELSQLVLERLQEDGAALPRLPDYFEMVQLGYAIKNQRGFHDATPIGKFAADSIANAYARDLQIHFFIPGEGRFDFTLRCTCGKFSVTHSKNQGHWTGARLNYIGQHLQKVAADALSIVPAAEPVGATADMSDVDACIEVYGRDETGDEFNCLEEGNDCTDAGGHIWLHDICLHCKSRAPA